MSSQSQVQIPPPIPQQKASPAKGRFGFSKVLRRWWWLATVFVAAITYVVSQVPTWMGMAGPLHESVVLVEVKPVVDVNLWAPTRGGVNEFGAQRFIKTQFEIIRAESTLEVALAKKGMRNRLGGSQNEAIVRMRKSIRTSQRRGTDLVEIAYRDEDVELAYDGAVTVYEAYKERRERLEMERRKDYETARKALDSMPTKHDLEGTKMLMPTSSIIVHELPERSTRAVTRGRDFYAALGTVCSLPFSIGLGILLMYIAEMIIPRRG